MLELRGPYDVINLALLLGISPEQARSAITSNCQAALAKGAARKTQGCAASVQVVKLVAVPTGAGVGAVGKSVDGLKKQQQQQQQQQKAEAAGPGRPGQAGGKRKRPK